MENYDIDTTVLPELLLPTLNGKNKNTSFTSNYVFFLL